MKQAIIGLVTGLLFSIVGILVVGSQVKGIPRVEEVWPLILAILLTVASWFLQGSMLAILANPQIKRSRVYEMTRIYLGSNSVGDVTPFMGGELPYEVFALSRTGLSAGMSGAIIAVKAILNFTVLVTGAVIGFFLVPIPVRVGGKFMLGIAVGMALVWALVAFLVRRSGGGTAPTRSQASSQENSDWRAKASKFYRQLRRGFSRIWAHQPQAILICGLLQILYWIVFPLIGALSLKAAGWSGNMAEVWVALLVLYLVLPISPTPGGSGAAELGFAALVGTDASGQHGTLLGGVLIWRALTYYLPLVVGGFFVIRHVENEIFSRHPMHGSLYHHFEKIRKTR